MPFRLSRWAEKGPGFAGPLRLTALLALVVLVLAPGPRAAAHGGAFEVVIEAVNLSEDPTRLAYGIVLTFVDGHEVAGATVTVTANADDGSVIEAVADETTPGVYIADLTLDPGSWRVTVTVEGPDAEGSVEFSEEVGGLPLTRPVVRVDTVDSSRQGEVVVDSVFEAAAPAPAAEPGTTVRVEALVRDAVAPLIIEYGVVTDVTDPAVSVTARTAESVVVGSVSLTLLTPGVFAGVIEYPEGGTWQVTVTVEGAEGGVANFTEKLPWPHYTTEAGSPKIKVNRAEPSLEGSLISITESPIFGLAGTGTTPSTATVAADETTPDTPEGDVVISIPSSIVEVGRQVGLRWLHLAGIGVWAVSVAAVGLGRRDRWLAMMAVGGVIAVMATGTALMLWGAPTTFPGILSWAELGARLYGPSYQGAFLIKMAFVATGVVATAFLVARSTRARLAVAAGSMLGALAAVVVMAQLHLFAHL